MNHTTNPQDERERLAGLLAIHVDHVAAAIRVHTVTALPEDKPGLERAAGLLALHKGNLLAEERSVGAEVLLDAALGLLPAVSSSAVVSADRATPLREAATRLWHQTSGLTEYGRGARWAIGELRRLANEAEFAATPCAPVVPCEDGGEPCDVHERMLGHYEDSHELCPPDCGATGGPSRVAAEEQPAETQDDFTESVIYEVVGNWGVDSADSAEEARAAVAKWLRAYPKCGAHAQQRIYRDWPDGSEYYGPWTDLPAVGEQPAGKCPCGHPHDEHSVYGCIDGCDCDRMFKRPAVGERPDTQTPKAGLGRCSAVMLRVHHAPHGWEPQPGMDPVHCPGYPQPGKES